MMLAKICEVPQFPFSAMEACILSSRILGNQISVMKSFGGSKNPRELTLHSYSRMFMDRIRILKDDSYIVPAGSNEDYSPPLFFTAFLDFIKRPLETSYREEGSTDTLQVFYSPLVLHPDFYKERLEHFRNIATQHLRN